MKKIKLLPAVILLLLIQSIVFMVYNIFKPLSNFYSMDEFGYEALAMQFTGAFVIILLVVNFIKKDTK